MLNDKIAQLYRQTEKQPQTQRQQPQTVAKWWQDSFWKKIIIAIVVILAISAFAGIVFSFLGYMEMRDSMSILGHIR